MEIKTKFQCTTCKGTGYYGSGYSELVRQGMTCNCGGKLIEINPVTGTTTPAEASELLQKGLIARDAQ